MQNENVVCLKTSLATSTVIVVVFYVVAIFLLILVVLGESFTAKMLSLSTKTVSVVFLDCPMCLFEAGCFV